MPTPPARPPTREEFDALLARVKLLSEQQQQQQQRDSGQDAQLAVLRQQRDTALEEKHQSDVRTFHIKGVLRRLERLTLTVGILLVTYALVVMNERGGEPDPVLRRWALVGGGGASLLVLTGHSDVIGKFAEKWLGGRHGGTKA